MHEGQIVRKQILMNRFMKYFEPIAEVPHP